MDGQWVGEWVGGCMYGWMNGYMIKQIYPNVNCETQMMGMWMFIAQSFHFSIDFNIFTLKGWGQKYISYLCYRSNKVWLGFYSMLSHARMQDDGSS